MKAGRFDPRTKLQPFLTNPTAPHLAPPLSESKESKATCLVQRHPRTGRLPADFKKALLAGFDLDFRLEAVSFDLVGSRGQLLLSTAGACPADLPSILVIDIHAAFHRLIEHQPTGVRGGVDHFPVAGLDHRFHV